MKKLFSIGLLFGGFTLSAVTAQADDAAIIPLSAPPAAPAAEEASADAVIDQYIGKQVSFTSELLGSGPACGAHDCAPSPCGPGKCGASQGCDGGSCDSGCPLFSDEPLLGFLKNQSIADCWTYSIGGELRYRYMDEESRLRPGGAARTTYDLWRFTPYLEVKNGDDFTAYVQAIDASIFNHELPITGIDQNRSDLVQFYIDVKLAEGCDGEKLRARIGRQFLKYGSQHLVSPLGWSNTFRNFEGGRLYYTSKDWNIDAFITQPVNAAATNFFRPFSDDNPDQSKMFSGVYSTWKGTENQVMDLYWLWVKEDQDRATAIDGNRHTIGARWEGKSPVKECDKVVGTWNWELEGAYQFGEESFGANVNEDIQAGFISGVFGYTWNAAPWTPSLKGVFWYGSGDDDPTDGDNNTVSTLFPLGHAHWGIIDNFNGQNLIDYSIQGSIKPADKWTVVSQLHWFERAESADSVYNVAGVPVIAGGASDDLGTEVDLIATYAASKNLTLQAGYSKFFYGDVVTGRQDADFFYFMATLGF